jgi:hypothetical protein
VLDNKVSNLPRNLNTISRRDSLAENLVRSIVVGESPAAKGKDPLGPFNACEFCKLVCGERVADFNLKVWSWGQCIETKVKVSVLRRVNLEGVLVQALAAQTVALEIGELDTTVASSPDNINTAVRDTAIGALLGSARRAGISVNTKVPVNSTLALYIATCVEGTWVYVSNVGAICGRLRS